MNARITLQVTRLINFIFHIDDLTRVRDIFNIFKKEIYCF